MLHEVVERRLNGVDSDVFVKIANDHKENITRLSDAAHNAVAGNDGEYHWKAIEAIHNLEYNSRSLGRDIDQVVNNWKSDLQHIEQCVFTILKYMED